MIYLDRLIYYISSAVVPGESQVLPGTGGIQEIEPGKGGVGMWETIGDGVGSFIENVVTPVGTFCANNQICLAFLSVTFVGLGIRLLRRAISAFGRGR